MNLWKKSLPRYSASLQRTFYSSLLEQGPCLSPLGELHVFKHLQIIDQLFSRF